jgi:D-glycero-alpha-D-manno-heptose 1-phosphate guanylyltransferase
MVAAVILAGGQGTRIRHLHPETPKPLIEVASKPWLEWLLMYLKGQGVAEVVVSAGHLADKVAEFIEQRRNIFPGISAVVEPEPLGTAGGFLHAAELGAIHSEEILVMNGDSLALCTLGPLFECLRDPDTKGALLGLEMADASRYGTLSFSDNGNLSTFVEKRPGVGVINAGVYLFKKNLLANFSKKLPLSFEFDVFPELIACGNQIKVVRCDGDFIDIGTEASLSGAEAFIDRNMEWFL